MTNSKNITRFFIITLLICSRQDLRATDISVCNECVTSTQNNSHTLSVDNSPVSVSDLSPNASAKMSKRHLEERKEMLRDRVKIAALKTRIWMRSKMSYTKDAFALGLDNVKKAINRTWDKTKKGTHNSIQKIKNMWRKADAKIQVKREHSIEIH